MMLTPTHLETYCRIKSDPCRRGGYKLDDALIFCEAVERRLEKVGEEGKTILLLQAQGYTQEEIAWMDGVSLRTMVRMIQKINSVVFEELISTIGKVQLFPTTASIGKRLGRPRKAAA